MLLGVNELLQALKRVSLRDLPWRHTRDPYKILVSEMMLQQTQVERMVPFYTRFIRQFPTPWALAKAPLCTVLKAWQGLGYNRRAKYLHQTAAIISNQGWHEKLPGVGSYTKAAVEAFAHNKPTVFVETNIRTVFIHHCFPRTPKVSDSMILVYVKKALKQSGMEPREFYARVMDYGALLKKQGIKLNSRSKHYSKQSAFEGSERQTRGLILKALLRKPATLRRLYNITGRRKGDLTHVLANLSTEGLIQSKGNKFYIAS